MNTMDGASIIKLRESRKANNPKQFWQDEYRSITYNPLHHNSTKYKMLVLKNVGKSYSDYINDIEYWKQYRAQSHFTDVCAHPEEYTSRQKAEAVYNAGKSYADYCYQKCECAQLDAEQRVEMAQKRNRQKQLLQSMSMPTPTLKANEHRISMGSVRIATSAERFL